MRSLLLNGVGCGPEVLYKGMSSERHSPLERLCSSRTTFRRMPLLPSRASSPMPNHGSCRHGGQKPAITAAGLPLKRRLWMRLAVHVQHVDTEHIECPCHKCPRPGSHIARAIAQAKERGYTDLSASPALPTDAARPRPCAILAPRLDL